MSEWTPGPWGASCCDVTGERELGDSGVRFWSITTEGKYRGDVASVHSATHIGGITLQERDANAHLIAAAPDLYEALEAAEDAIAEHLPGLEYLLDSMISPALARARGEAQ